jgi:hypothetical protein
LYAALYEKEPRLSQMYLGAVSVLTQEANPERHRQAAHTLRQMMNSMPDAMGLDAEVLSERMGDRVQKPKSVWAKAVRRSACLADGKWQGMIDAVLARALAEIGDFFTWLEKNAPRRRDTVALIVRELDRSGRALPPALEELVVSQWNEIREYFIGVCKERPVEEAEFSQYISALEWFLLDRLLPRTFDDQMAIDDILREAGDVADT